MLYGVQISLITKQKKPIYPKNFSLLNNKVIDRTRMAAYLSSLKEPEEDGGYKFVPIGIKILDYPCYYVYDSHREVLLGYWYIQSVDTENSIWEIYERDEDEYIKYYILDQFNRVDKVKIK